MAVRASYRPRRHDVRLYGRCPVHSPHASWAGARCRESGRDHSAQWQSNYGLRDLEVVLIYDDQILASYQTNPYVFGSLACWRFSSVCGLVRSIFENISQATSCKSRCRFWRSLCSQWNSFLLMVCGGDVVRTYHESQEKRSTRARKLVSENGK